MRIRHRQTARAVAMAAALGAVVALGGCASSPDDGVTTLSFFQFKGEALEDLSLIHI